MTPSSIREQGAWQSLVCGKKITDAKLKEDLRRSSLLHLFVVSGSHLIWIERVLSVLHLPLIARFIIWTIFTAMCAADPPVIRAGLGLAAAALARPLLPRWRGDQRVLAAGLLSLALYPPWFESLSLALSWAAGLAMALPAGRGWRGELLRAAGAWLFLYPLLSHLEPAHPLGILVNVLVAPLVGLVFLPVAALAFLPGMDLLFDGCMAGLRTLLGLLHSLPDYQGPGWRLSSWQRWAWIIGWHLIIHGVHLSQRQGRDHSTDLGSLS